MSCSAMIKELYSTENDLMVLSVMLAFSSGMFVAGPIIISFFVRQEMYLK